MRAVSHIFTRQPWFVIRDAYWFSPFTSSPMDLYIFRFLRWTQTCSSPTVCSSLLFPDLVFGFCDLLVEAEAQKSLSTSAFSMSWIIRSPISFLKWHTFSLVYLLSLAGLQMLLLLLFFLFWSLFVKFLLSSILKKSLCAME